ncbi:MAG: hypothetical protein HKN94_01825 [Acidimicrobiales bacterium]|nr:hypothetical protein [Acidimicrobiales bacterium]RZV41800.1 MAG: hypothetical protein EX269_15810 [Acidimicrobiales bacterium]
MSVLLAMMSTISIGMGEFVAGGVTARARSHEVTATMFLTGTASMVVVALFWSGDPTNGDLAYGALAGVANGLGILLLYRSYATATVRVAAPTAAVIMSAVPVGWDVLISGNSPSPIVSVGLVVGLAAIGLSSYSPGASAIATNGVRLAVVGGAVFGVLFILLSQIGDDAGGTPLLLQRTVGFLLAVAVARATGPRIFPPLRRDFLQSCLIGLFAAAAIVTFVLALQTGGNLAVVSVVGSQYAAVAVLLGIVFRGEHLWWWQGVGLAGASLAVALISLG